MRRVTLRRIGDGREIVVKAEAVLRCIGTDLAFKVIDRGRADVTDGAWSLLFDGIEGFDRDKEGA